MIFNKNRVLQALENNMGAIGLYEEIAHTNADAAGLVELADENDIARGIENTLGPIDSLRERDLVVTDERAEELRTVVESSRPPRM